MSEKFVVGQWVTVDGYGEPGRIRWIEDVGKIANVEWPKAKTASTLLLSLCKPFIWQVVCTYRTTLDGVTATVASVEGDRVEVAVPWKRGFIVARKYHATTGMLCGFEDRDDVPHLLPHLADEPPPVAEAATYSEFAEADECNPFIGLREWAQREFDACQHQATLWNERGLIYATVLSRLEIERAKS